MALGYLLSYTFMVVINVNLHEIFWESSYGLNYLSNLNLNFRVLTAHVSRLRTTAKYMVKFSYYA